MTEMLALAGKDFKTIIIELVNKISNIMSKQMEKLNS